MSYRDGDFSRFRPGSSTPPVGSPIFSGYMDSVAQSYRSNQLAFTAARLPRISSTDEPPLLKRHKVDFTPDEPITHLAAGSNRIILGTKAKKVIAIDTSSGEQIDCDLVRYLGTRLLQARVYRIFLEPSGKFTLISLAHASDNQPMENLLFVRRLQPLRGLKNHLISAVAWNYPKCNTLESTNSTGTILLGTTKGLILQTELIHSDETKFFPLNTGPMQYFKEVFDVGVEVTGLEYHQVPSKSETEKEFIIIVSTNQRLYRMAGSVPANVEPPPLHLIFSQNANKYKEVPGKDNKIWSGLNKSNLDIYYPQKNHPPTRFAWLTEPGIMTCEIGSDEDLTIVPYDNSHNSTIQQPVISSSSASLGMSPPFSYMPSYERPISVVAGNFHVIVLFRHCLKAICILNDATVYEEHFSDEYGNIQGMCRDPMKNIIWVHSERAVYKYKILKESANIWKMYMEQGKFELAKKLTLDDEANHNRVICEEAQHYFKLKEYEKSAEMFARSKKPLEDVGLMFLEINNMVGLKKYLTIKLEQYEPSQIQFFMILGWLLEIIISEPESETHLDQLCEDPQIVECLKQHPELLRVIRNHGEMDVFVKMSKLIGEHKEVLQYYMNHGQFKSALELMKAIRRDEYFYLYGHQLMKRMPTELVDALMDQPRIDPVKLIPVLIQENPYSNKCAETIRYIEFCLRDLKSDRPELHNYLFELYAQHRDEETLISYLESELNTDGLQQCCLDLQKCLRLCLRLGLNKACVTLYSNMGLYDEALDRALCFDIELAKSIAKKPESMEDQRRLWLTIPRAVLSNNPDAEKGASLLRECRLLKPQDILPFFPNCKSIDSFKGAVLKSLREYCDQLQEFKDEAYEERANQIRANIKAFRERYIKIVVSETCRVCERRLLTRTFCIFPCGHLFHKDCIIKEMLSINPEYKGFKDASRSEQEEIISSECMYCGGLLLSCFNKPPPMESELLNIDE